MKHSIFEARTAIVTAAHEATIQHQTLLNPVFFNEKRYNEICAKAEIVPNPEIPRVFESHIVHSLRGIYATPSGNIWVSLMMQPTHPEATRETRNLSGGNADLFTAHVQDVAIYEQMAELQAIIEIAVTADLVDIAFSQPHSEFDAYRLDEAEPKFELTQTYPAGVVLAPDGFLREVFMPLAKSGMGKSLFNVAVALPQLASTEIFKTWAVMPWATRDLVLNLYAQWLLNRVDAGTLATLGSRHPDRPDVVWYPLSHLRVLVKTYGSFNEYALTKLADALAHITVSGYSTVNYDALEEALMTVLNTSK